MTLEAEYIKKICPYCKDKENYNCNIKKFVYKNYICCKCTSYVGTLKTTQIKRDIKSNAR